MSNQGQYYPKAERHERLQLSSALVPTRTMGLPEAHFVLIRNTVREGSELVKEIDGVTYSMQLTENSVIYKGVELLTESLTQYRGCATLTSPHAPLTEPIYTSLGLVYAHKENIVLVNANNQIVAEMPLSIVNYFKMLSYSKYNASSPKITEPPYLTSSLYGFQKTLLFPREELLKAIVKRGPYVKYMDKYIKLSDNYERIVQELVSINGPDKLPSEYLLEKILENNYFSQWENRRFLVYNNNLLELNSLSVISSLPLGIYKLQG